MVKSLVVVVKCSWVVKLLVIVIYFLYNDIRFYLFFNVTKINNKTIGIISNNKISTSTGNNAISLDITNIPIPNLGNSGIINIPTSDLGGLLGILKINKFINH